MIGRTVLAFVVCGIFGSAAAFPVAGGDAQQPVFRTGVAGVSVIVSVRKGNAPVPGLSSADFEVFDNGVPQRISAFVLEKLPVDVTLLLHVSRSIAGYRLAWLQSSVREAEKLLKPDDRRRLISVQHVLKELAPLQPVGAPVALETLVASGGTALYDALSAALMRPSEAGRGQLVVAFTTGVDTISIQGLDAVEAVAGLSDAVVYLVVPVAGSSGVRSGLADAAPLSPLVTRSGGQIFPADIEAPLAGAFTRAIEEFRTSYVLHYVPEGVSPEGRHEIKVNVKGGPYDVRARKGYGG